MSTRAQQIVAMRLDHVGLSKQLTDAEWRGYLWRLHDNNPRYRPNAAGTDIGVEIADLTIARDKADDEARRR